MSKKIGLVYLDVSNLGDVVIYETARYIVDDILKKNHVEDYELIPISMGSYRCRVESMEKSRVLNFIDRGYAYLYRRYASYKVTTKKKFRKMREYRLLKYWKKTDVWRYFKKNEMPKLEQCDMLIFCGGGLIKFHKQNFYLFLNELLEYADKRNIPVLINSQGIEGYDKNDIRCEMLIKAINRDCVKYISTRDDFPMLRNCYMTNMNTVVKAVCDPAFWSAETYQIKKKETEKKVIGLNVIRTKIFKEYMYKVSREELGELYYGLIQKLTANGYQVELFSNGVDKDSFFIDWMFENYPDLEETYKISVAKPDTTKGLVETLAGYDRFVAIRLHASIIGSVLGVPNVSLVWNKKQILFGKQIGMPQNYLVKDEFDVDKVYNTLMNAKPYIMDQNYKMSVYQALNDEIMKWI